MSTLQVAGYLLAENTFISKLGTGTIKSETFDNMLSQAGHSHAP